MPLTIFTGSAHVPLAPAVAEQLGVSLGSRRVHRFPDGELHVELQESVRGRDVYLLQPTSPAVEAHLFELLFLADACRRAGAAYLTAVVPYFGYARQDRRASGREAVGARLIADLLAAGGVQRLVAVDLHSTALEGFFAFPVEHLSAVSLVTEAVRPALTPDTVIVAPDLGAVKLAERYARRLHLPMAIVDKERLTGEEVRVRRVVGRVAGCPALIVDDMISTAGTVQAAIQALFAADASPEVTVATTHALLVGPAVERLQPLPVRRLVATAARRCRPISHSPVKWWASLPSWPRPSGACTASGRSAISWCTRKTAAQVKRGKDQKVDRGRRVPGGSRRAAIAPRVCILGGLLLLRG